MNSGIIHSVSKATRVLSVVADAPSGLSVTEISQKTGIQLSTCHHLVKTLLQDNLLQRAAQPHQYVLGQTVRYWGNQYLRQHPLPDLVQDTLNSVARETGETTYLAIWRETRSVIIAIAHGSQALRVDGLVLHYGSHTLARASGKLLLAFQDAQTVETVLSQEPLIPRTPRTLTQPDQIYQELARIRTDQVAYDREEFEVGIQCIAVPVYTLEQRVIAALSISYPSVRSTHESEYVCILKHAAHDLLWIGGVELEYYLASLGNGASR
ncbi:MAG: IclR family transcriptional regulator [Firmicutes bacterium]|nr:IclR family transcriptional regulator [Bacillota bacterium]